MKPCSNGADPAVGVIGWHDAPRFQTYAAVGCRVASSRVVYESGLMSASGVSSPSD